MKEFWNAITQLKLPSMLMVIIFAGFSFYFLQSSPPISSTKGIVGALFCAAAIFSGTYAFIHYLISENYKKIIDTQSTVMKNITKTHTKIEKQTQTSLGFDKVENLQTGEQKLPGGYTTSSDGTSIENE
jgi:hypothetical protein